jgi:carbon monoxide dehydrogenase subunit G
VRLENSFTAPASPARVWALLTDVPVVVPCMPGAELVEQVDETTWKANVKVKLGPISMTFGAVVREEEADEAARRLRLVADARELRGRGMARAEVAASVQPSDDGSLVEIVTDLDLSGAVAQYGRGIVKDVAGQLTATFAQNLRDRLEGEPPAAAAARPVSGIRLLVRALLARFRRARDETPPPAGEGA